MIGSSSAERVYVVTDIEVDGFVLGRTRCWRSPRSR